MTKITVKKYCACSRTYQCLSCAKPELAITPMEHAAAHRRILEKAAKQRVVLK